MKAIIQGILQDNHGSVLGAACEVSFTDSGSIIDVQFLPIDITTFDTSTDFVSAAQNAIIAYSTLKGYGISISDIIFPFSPPTHYMSHVIVDFGDHGYSATTTANAPWVLDNTKLFCRPSGIAQTGHEPEDVLYERLTANVTKIVPGVSIDVTAYAPTGTRGQYLIEVSGTN